MDVPNPFGPTPIPADVQNRLFQIMTGQPNAQLPPLNATPPTGNLAQLLLPPGTQFQAPAVPSLSTARVPDVHNTAPLSQMLLPTLPPSSGVVGWAPDLSFMTFSAYLNKVSVYINTRGQITEAPYDPTEIAVYDAIINRSNATNTSYAVMMRRYFDLFSQQMPAVTWSIQTNERLMLGRFKRYLEQQLSANTTHQWS